MKKFLYSKFVKKILYFFFCIFYDKKYLKGYYFDEKRMGWYWAYKGLKGRLFGPNKKVPWPVNNQTIVSNPNNIKFDVDNINIFQTPGCYWQGHNAEIHIGKNCYVAPNVGLITANHNVYNLKKHEEGKSIILGDNCWIGMNAVILPGVQLGKSTIVAAGAVVTKSFPEGFCVVGGVPAHIIKYLDPSKFDEQKGE